VKETVTYLVISVTICHAQQQVNFSQIIQQQFQYGSFNPIRPLKINFETLPTKNMESTLHLADIAIFIDLLPNRITH
jgi:hypothetical protein